MHRLSRALPVLILALPLLQACSLFDKPEPAPAYLAIRNARVELDSVTQFSSPVGIRSAFVYHAGQLQHIVRLRQDSVTVVPITDLTRTDFVLEGAVFETGQSAFNVTYPFWKPLNFTAQPQGLDTIVLEPVFEYIDPPFYDLFMNEGFEGGSVDLVPFSRALTQSDSTFVRTRNNSNAFQGAGYGYVNFGPGDRYFEAITATPFRLIRGLNAFAEVTYRSTIPLNVGLVYQNVGVGVGVSNSITLTPSADWNTVFVNLVPQVRSIVNAGGEDTDFWLWLYADGNGESGSVELDDLRVLQEK